MSDLNEAAVDVGSLLDWSLAFKKDFNKLLYTYKEAQKNLQNKAKEMKKEKEDTNNKEEVVWAKEMGTESEEDSESISESSKEEERKRVRSLQKKSL